MNTNWTEVFEIDITNNEYSIEIMKVEFEFLKHYKNEIHLQLLFE